MISTPPATALAEPFPRPASLEAQVRFWRAIFTDYSKHQVVLHDAVDLNKVYKVLDFRAYADDAAGDGEIGRYERLETDLEMDRLRATLLRLHALGGRAEGLSAEERRIWEMYRDDASPDRFLAAADDKRLHSQRGLRERFFDGLRVSRRYLPEMERIFREEGLPVELTRLPLIESCFNLHAYSKAGAAGIWQFMPATGRHFMEVGALVDERRDPIASTRAAAHFLSHMHDDLGTWPLAITAWNHGPDGVARAVRQVGTVDIAAIIRDYRGAAFGFASRNFYAEFLAALEVERTLHETLAKLPAAPAPVGHEYRLDRSLGIEQAARLARTDRETLVDLNPALMAPVIGGRRPIPRGYRLRLPEHPAGFASRLADLGAEERATSVAAVERPTRVAAVERPTRVAAHVQHAALRHRVARGQTLTHIARRYRVSVATLRTANRLGKHRRLRTGQVLRIPRSV